MSLPTSLATNITLASLIDRWGGGEFDFLMWGPQDSSGVYVFVRFAGKRRFASYRVTDAFFSIARKGSTSVTIGAGAVGAAANQALSPALSGATSDYLLFGTVKDPVAGAPSFAVTGLVSCILELTSLSNLSVGVGRGRRNVNLDEFTTSLTISPEPDTGHSHTFPNVDVLSFVDSAQEPALTVTVFWMIARA